MLHKVAAAAGDDVVKKCVDQDSGRQSGRKAFQQVLADAQYGQGSGASVGGPYPGAAGRGP